MNTFTRFFISLAIGVVELGLLIALTGGMTGNGSSGTLGQLVVLSVLCTFGVGLIIWIPLLCAVGYVQLGLIELFFVYNRVGQQSATTPALGRSPANRSSIPSISRYIERMQGAGVPDEMILARLKRAGWSDDEVRRASSSTRP